jgi:DDE superfamily endonuclease
MVETYGKENIYYQDESGFDEYFTRRYGYSYTGEKIYTQLSGKRYERQSVMGLLDHNNKLIEPMIYKDNS